MKFKEWISGHERAEFARQAAEDMALHQKAPADLRYTPHQNQMLAADVPWKQSFKDLMEKPKFDPSDVKTAEKLRDKILIDRKSHVGYLHTRDRAHHQKWIMRYNSWLSGLEKIIQGDLAK